MNNKLVTVHFLVEVWKDEKYDSRTSAFSRDEKHNSTIKISLKYLPIQRNKLLRTKFAMSN